MTDPAQSETRRLATQHKKSPDFVSNWNRRSTPSTRDEVGSVARKVSAFPLEGDPIEQMTGLNIEEANDPVEALRILRGITTARTLCVWSDGTYRVMPTLDVPIARQEEGSIVAVIPMAEVGEVGPVTGEVVTVNSEGTNFLDLRRGTTEDWLRHGQSIRPFALPAPQDDALRIAVEALEPFARFAENVDAEGWTSNIHRERISVWFGPSEFIRAAEALAALKSTAGQEGGAK